MRLLRRRVLEDLQGQLRLLGRAEEGPAVCTNMATIRREDLENTVLNALEHHLLDEEAVEIFC